MYHIYFVHSSLLINIYNIVPILCFNEECYKDCPHQCRYLLCVHIRIFDSYTMSSRKDFQLMIQSGSTHCLFRSFLGFHFYASCQSLVLFKFKVGDGTEEMVQQLWAFSALLEDLNWVSQQLTSTWKCSSRCLDTIFWPSKAPAHKWIHSYRHLNTI